MYMNLEQLKIMSTGKGFIAALDQSGGSTPKALKLYGIDETRYSDEEQMYMLVHQMRTRIIKSPSFTNRSILGAILFENTMERMIDDFYTADYLWQVKHIVPFLKIDKGLSDLVDGVQMMKDMPNLEDLLKRAVNRHIFGTKMRSVIKAANPKGIKAIVKQQFEVAKVIIGFGLVPIIEPEIDINITDKKQAEDMLLTEIKKELDKMDKDVKVIFKLSLPTIPNFYQELTKDSRVVRVVALSGGYSREVANEKLALNHSVIASFSRALSEGLNDTQTELEFNKLLKQTIDSIYDASIT